MCGIFGILTNDKSSIGFELAEGMTTKLFKLSESRGKEAAGFAALSDSSIKVYKEPVSSSALVLSKKYSQILKDIFVDEEKLGQNKSFAVIGHSRLMTNGAQSKNENNQPVVKDGIVGVHNGIIVNGDSLWADFPGLKKKYEVDTEVLLSLTRMFLKKGKSPIEAIQKTFDLIRGTVSVGLLFNDLACLLLVTNTGSLYFSINREKNLFVFASEAYILKNFLGKFKKTFGEYQVSQVKPGLGYIVGINDLSLKEFSLEGEIDSTCKNCAPLNLEIIDLSPKYEDKELIQEKEINSINLSDISKHYYETLPRINYLKRCTKCILPETMPFIEFDEDGVCNYCRNYKKNEVEEKEALENFVSQYRSDKGEPDCIVPFSGGRDSSYGLHYIKKVLKMNPITYTYDWGMVTDLARRNQARLCGKLGIEHILVSADINKKREYIRKNVLAWLKKPDLGTVPLFMAGDKHYFYYANKLREQTGAKLIVMSMNPLERTDFKYGFSKVRPLTSNKKMSSMSYQTSSNNKLKLLLYYGKQFILNPSYFNSSLWDTFTGYISYYFIPHNYLFLYSCIKWDEKEIENTLIKEYDWEVAKDTKSTWRIGDGTAPFYNYIYYIVAGFTENDTFRSNQIREGVITREEALKLIEEENKPRYGSIKWYCDTIGIDFEKTLKIINSIPKLYKV